MKSRSRAVIGAHFGRAGPTARNGSRRVTQLAEVAHPGVRATSQALAKHRMRAARTFMSPEAAGAPIYTHLGFWVGGGALVAIGCGQRNSRGARASGSGPPRFNVLSATDHPEYERSRILTNETLVHWNAR